MKLRTLIVGCGHMGQSHAHALHAMEDVEIVGLVSRKPKSRDVLSEQIGGYPTYSSFEEGLTSTKPDAVVLSTHPQTHALFAILAMQQGAHVFVEKPLATTMDEAQEVLNAAEQYNKKVVVGYILRHHPSWQKFIKLAHELGKPLVMRLNLNQQSTGSKWDTHLSLLKSMTPLSDCGVHYVDVMCQMTKSRPVAVSAIAAKLSKKCKNPNYGQLQVTFEDDSVGWYECGWGPMMSDNAHFIKDVIGPKGALSMLPLAAAATDDINSHTRAQRLRLHQLDQSEKWIDLADEPNHQELCSLEQRYFINAIQSDLDLTEHLQSACDSLYIVLAADEAARLRRTVELIN